MHPAIDNRVADAAVSKGFEIGLHGLINRRNFDLDCFGAVTAAVRFAAALKPKTSPCFAIPINIIVVIRNSYGRASFADLPFQQLDKRFALIQLVFFEDDIGRYRQH